MQRCDFWCMRAPIQKPRPTEWNFERRKKELSEDFLVHGKMISAFGFCEWMNERRGAETNKNHWNDERRGKGTKSCDNHTRQTVPIRRNFSFFRVSCVDCIWPGGFIRHYPYFLFEIQLHSTLQLIVVVVAFTSLRRLVKCLSVRA